MWFDFLDLRTSLQIAEEESRRIPLNSGMPSAYEHLNNAFAVVATQRSPGGTSLVVDDATRFAGASFPIRLSILRFADESSLYPDAVTILRATGLTGNSFAIDGTAGLADATCQVGDTVVNAWTSEDLDEVWEAIDAIDLEPLQDSVDSLTSAVSAKADASDLAALDSVVDSLTTTVSAKADASDLASLETDVTSLTSTIASKADASDLASLETDVTSLTSTVATLGSRVTSAETDIDNIQADYLTSNSNLNASKLASGTVAVARLGSGTADNTTYLRGDGTWSTVSGGGGMAIGGSISSSTANRVLYVGTGGVLSQDAGLTYSATNQQLRIGSGGSGLVGNLHVEGTSDTRVFIRASATQSSNLLDLRDSGNVSAVGMGHNGNITASGVLNLTKSSGVAMTAAAPITCVDRVTITNTAVPNSSTGGSIIINSDAGTSNPQTHGSRLGYMLWGGQRGNGIAAACGITAFATENWTTTANGSEFAFETIATGTTARYRRLKICHDGEIAINADVNAPATANLMTIRGSGSHTGSMITIKNSSNSTTMSVDASGKIAVGSHAPAAGLDIGGGAGLVVRNSVNADVAGFDAKGGLRLPSLADSSANNSTLYFSTNSNKPSWKDSSGVSHDLY